ncbi:MAG: glutathione peroxidase [Mangrovibacterium sp.]
MSAEIYNFKTTTLAGKEISLADFKGKTLLIVNTASKCGLTPQFEGLEKLYQQYKNKGLVILGFPCNQFANQEPGEKSDIEAVCMINYGVSFPMFAKIEVNGENAHPLYQYLKSELKGTLGNKIKWNFTKFLIGANGTPIKRFSPTAKPDKIGKCLAKLIG